MLLAISSISITLFGGFKTPLPTRDTPAAASHSAQKIKLVVLDAGHGGKDPGAMGRNSREKDIALQVALKLGKRIEAEMPGVRVLYTRNNDRFIDLYERPAVANRNHADLFVSIHCNSASSRAASGTETFVLGYNSTANQDVAIRENASILMEENYKENYGGYDPKDPSSIIVFQLMKKQYRNQSIKLASYMQAEFTRSKRINRGVKELPLAVLKTAGMPAVLTEIGFISNSTEESYMMSAQGQKEIVDDLYNAINTFRKNVER